MLFRCFLRRQMASQKQVLEQSVLKHLLTMLLCYVLSEALDFGCLAVFVESLPSLATQSSIMNRVTSFESNPALPGDKDIVNEVLLYPLLQLF